MISPFSRRKSVFSSEAMPLYLLACKTPTF